MPLDMHHIRKLIETHLRESSVVKQNVIELCMESIVSASSILTEAFREGRKLLICGNGGSAADSQHMAAEFVSRLTKNFDRPALPALALTTDTSFLTAYTNDIGVDGIFAREVEAFGREGDVLIGITTSGTSKNVVQATKSAKTKGMRTIAFTGQNGLQSADADVVVAVPSLDTQYIQESHIAVEHIICEIVERNLYGGGNA